MNTYSKIESEINNVKNWNQEAGHELHCQLHTATNSYWSKSGLSELIKSDEDVADKYYSDGDLQHAEIREIQDLIINEFGE